MIEHDGVLLEVRVALMHACTDNTGEKFTRYSSALRSLNRLIAAVPDDLGEYIEEGDKEMNEHPDHKLAMTWEVFQVGRLLHDATTEKSDE